MKVAVLGKLGADNFGDIMAEALRHERVDTVQSSVLPRRKRPFPS